MTEVVNWKKALSLFFSQLTPSKPAASSLLIVTTTFRLVVIVQPLHHRSRLSITMVMPNATRSLSSILRQLTLSTRSTPSNVRLASTSTSSPNGSNDAYSRARTPLLPPISSLPSRLKPVSPAYYTGRPAYIDTLLSLEQLTRETKRLLEQSYLLPPNSSAPSISAGRGNLWVSSAGLQSILGTNLKAAQYRQIISRLGLLARYAGLVNQYEGAVGGVGVEGVKLVEKFKETLERFMNDNANPSLPYPIRVLTFPRLYFLCSGLVPLTLFSSYGIITLVVSSVHGIHCSHSLCWLLKSRPPLHNCF